MFENHIGKGYITGEYGHTGRNIVYGGTPMKKCLKFAELNESTQKLIKEQLQKNEDDIKEDDIVVYPQEDNETFIAEYRGLKIAVRIKPPDQETSNNIWDKITTAGIVIAAVAVTLICSKKKSW